MSRITVLPQLATKSLVWNECFPGSCPAPFSLHFPHVGQPPRKSSSTNELQPLAIWMHIMYPQQTKREQWRGARTVSAHMWPGTRFYGTPFGSWPLLSKLLAKKYTKYRRISYQWFSNLKSVLTSASYFILFTFQLLFHTIFPKVLLSVHRETGCWQTGLKDKSSQSNWHELTSKTSNNE